MLSLQSAEKNQEKGGSKKVLLGRDQNGPGACNTPFDFFVLFPFFPHLIWIVVPLFFFFFFFCFALFLFFVFVFVFVFVFFVFFLFVFLNYLFFRTFFYFLTHKNLFGNLKQVEKNSFNFSIKTGLYISSIPSS